MSTFIRQRAILNLQKKSSSHLLERAKAIYNGLLANPTMFVTPIPSLVALQKKIQAFDLADQATATHTRGTAAARDVKASQLITSLETLRAYVQELVDANPDQGAVIIEAAGMTVGQMRAYKKPLLQATHGKASGTVHLVANVGILTADTSGKVFFNWQYSDDGGKTWISALSTPHGGTDIAGLTPTETYRFRASVTDREGPGPWSHVVTFVVL